MTHKQQFELPAKPWRDHGILSHAWLGHKHQTGMANIDQTGPISNLCEPPMNTVYMYGPQIYLCPGITDNDIKWVTSRSKWNMSYTLFQKERNFFEVAFLFEKSVYQWIWGYTWRPYIQVSDPGPPGKMDKLKFLLEKSVEHKDRIHEYHGPLQSADF